VYESESGCAEERRQERRVERRRSILYEYAVR